MLVVGAETSEEFRYAKEVVGRGGEAVVANPVSTDESRAFARAGGKFYNTTIESLPASEKFDTIREDFPFPLAGLPPTQSFIESRLARLKPGGFWVILTENSEWVDQIRGAAFMLRTPVGVYDVPPTQEALPFSKWPQEDKRYIIIFAAPSR